MPVWLINIIVGLVLNLAVSFISTSAKPNDARGVRGAIQTGGTVSQSFIVGTYGTAGHREYIGSWGNAGATPNAYLTDVVSVSDLPITAITALWMNGEPITVDFGGSPMTQGYPSDEYSSNVWADFRDGTQTAVNSFLSAKFGTHLDRPWSNDMIGRGIGYVAMTALIDRELFNSLPKYMFECQGVPLYDVRKDSTAGGSGTHRLDTPTTWEWSDNPVVIIYNILTGIWYGSDWIYGMRTPVNQALLPYAVWSAAMDKCDELVDLDGGGSEKRYRAGAEIDVDTKPIDTINKLMQACNARMSELAGVYKIIVDDPGSAVAAITDDDLLVTNGQTFDVFPEIQDTVNHITATYPSPEEAWESKEAPPRVDTGLETADDSRRLSQHLSLDYVFSGTQAQRLMALAAKEGRRFRRHVVGMPPKWSVLEPLDKITWTSARNGYSTKEFLVTAIDEAPNGNVLVGLQEWDPTDYDWDETTEELPIDTAPLTPSRPAAQPMSGWTVVGASLKDDSGTGKIPTLQIGYTGPQSDVKEVQVQARLKSSGDVVFDGAIPYGSPYAVVLNTQLVRNTQYEARGKFIPYSSRTTDWSAWLTATTPDVGVDGVDSATQAAIDWSRASLRDLIEEFAQMAAAVADQDADNYVDQQEFKRAVGGNAAAFFTGIRLALTPEKVTAEEIAGVEAVFGDVSASAYTRMQAVAASQEGRVAYTISLRAGLADDFKTAGITIEIDTTTRESFIILDADRTIMTGAGGIFEWNGPLGTLSIGSAT